MTVQEYIQPNMHIFFCGIGGSSMSSLAQIAQTRGYRVAGSDMQESAMTALLKQKGISVSIGQKAENVTEAQPDLFVMTDAIAQTNPELLKARELQIPVFLRGEFLGWILDGYKTTIGIAGTHGKTTVSSMITEIELAADRDPSAIIGGRMNNINASYRLGQDGRCVFESCEFRESFRFFRSDISLVLNIAEDHMEYFKTRENLVAAFRRYLNNIRPGGTLVTNGENENVGEMLSDYDGTVLFFGEKTGHLRFHNVTLTNGLPSFDLFRSENNDENETFFAHINLRIPGRHNVQNATAAALAALVDGIGAEQIKKGLEAFTGCGRRFEYHCTVNGAVVADDYGHHPDAYRVTFSTARDLGFKRIIAIHQPHTFSRTKMLMNEFAEVLSTVDHVLIPPIYAARETNDLYRVDSRDLVARLPNAEYVPDFQAIADRIKEMAQPGDLFITLGCGNINKAAILTNQLYGETKFIDE